MQAALGVPPFIEGVNVNRPFQAFGALLILLALAMLAVNSGSRTTMFDRPPPKAKAYLPPRNSRLGGMYVVVLPASDVGNDEAVDTAIILPMSEVAPEPSDPAEADNRTLYDAAYDVAIYGELAGNADAAGAASRQAASHTPVRSGQWLLRFAASSLNQLAWACEAAARQLENAESESVASKAELSPR